MGLYIAGYEEATSCALRSLHDIVTLADVELDTQDLAAAPPKPEIIAVPRRNARAKAEVSRESYMTWTNKRAKSQHLK